MNFLPHEPFSPRQQGWVLAGLVLFGAALISIAVFTSPFLLIALAVMSAALFLTWKEPMWTVLFLSAYWPLEPFLLKFVNDDLYVYARFFSEIMVYVLFAVVFLSVLIGRYKRRRTPITIPAVLFLLGIAVSIGLNTLPITASLLGLRQIIRFVLLFFVVVWRYPRRFWIKRLAFVILAMVFIQSIIGVSQAVVGGTLDRFLLPSERRTFGEIQLTEGTVQFWDPGQRVFATMGRYDRLGTFLALGLLLSIGLMYEGNRKHAWINLSLLSVVAVPALILTYSRSAWFGLVLGGLAIAWIRKDRRVFVGTGIVVAVLAAYMGIVGLSSTLADVASQSVAERFFEAFTYNRFLGEYLGLGRVYWFVHTPLDVVMHSLQSALFGWGPGQFGAGAVSALGNTRVYDITGLPYGIHGTEGFIDNNWFALWGETGTLGIALYLWMYGILIAIAGRLAVRAKTALARGMGAAYVGIALAVALNALLATFLEVRTLAPYLWLLAGCVVVLASRERLIDLTVRRTPLPEPDHPNL